ncbi:transglutaminase-like domain-containing protein [Paenarthrobacter sp. DKR-5]|uniref:transglutaminase family protein n=1 Tax=Paenarthrobacter sp. DKR-5 TaxID=2835535 RepID=UPI001BDC6E4C|nr:DUF3488 and transglutaminase-like domain-containing protein [Paenarthrobacter sp. DKR-5]MBT1002438.1 transglutaminase-like domain-containing protein [Paenarthrobacter sp. DKR-5]
MAGAVFCAVAGSSLALNGVFRGWAWLPAGLVTTGGVLAAGAFARSLRAPAAVVHLVQAAALACLLSTQFLRSHSLLGFIPVPDTVTALGPLLGRARDTLVGETAPVQPNAAIVLAACAGLGAVAILTEALAVSLQLPALSGTGILAVLVVPALVKPESAGPLGFAAGAAGFLLILACSQWYAGGTPGRPGLSAQRSLAGGQAGRAALTGTAALAVTVLLTAVVPGFTTGTFPQGSRFNPWGSATGLNPMIALGNDLREASGQSRMTYATDATTPLYLRAVTLDDFEGSVWQPTPRDDQRQLGVGRMGFDVLGPGQSGKTTTTRIDSGDFSSPWLPVPYAPVSVLGLDGKWTWDPETLSIKGEDTNSAGQNYLVRSVTPDLGPAALAAAADPPRSNLDRQFLALPPVPDIIKSTENSVAGGARTPYEKALAIQRFLRSGDFTYSEQAPVDGGYDGSGMDVIAKFLQAKSGYCVHFASTMAVMARLAGIPSRIAVGYAPGEPTGRTVPSEDGVKLTEYQVDSRDAHAWPELYFEGLGWVPFEPTPSRGAVPDYAVTDSPQRPGRTSADSLDPRQAPSGAAAAPSAKPTTPAAAAPAPAQPARGTDWLPAAAGLLLAGLLAAAPAASRAALRRRRSGRPGGAAPWDELTDLAADYGSPPLASETPRRFAGRLLRGAAGPQAATDAVAASPGMPGPAGAPAEAEAALGRLARRYEETAYGRPGPESGGADEARREEARRDLSAVRSALRGRAPLLQRVRAVVLPASIFSRWGAWLRHPLRRRRRGHTGHSGWHAR